MASLKDIVKNYREEILDGIAWLVIWKDGRSWNIRPIWEDSGDTETGLVFEADIIADLKEVATIDFKAICINGYFCGMEYDFTNVEIMDTILRYYEARRYQLQGDFLGGLVAEVSP